MAVIDASAAFRTAVRGYDRAAVDALVRAEQARLQQLNERIAVLEHHLAAARGAAFRVDDPNRKQSIRAAADLLSDAWDDARQLVLAEDATAELQRQHAMTVAANHLAEVTAWAEEQERNARVQFDAMVGAACEDADRMRDAAVEFIQNAMPMAEQVLADAAAASQEHALAVENEMHVRRQALESDLTQRQIKADYDLQTAERLAAQVAQESAAVVQEAARVRETNVARAREVSDDLLHSVAHQIAALEDDADRAMASLAEHMAALSTEVHSARKAMVRPARQVAPQPVAAAEQPVEAAEEPAEVAEPETVAVVAPQPAPVPAAVRAAAAPVASTGDGEATAPMPKAKAPTRKAATAAPRTRKTTAVPAPGPKNAAKTAQSAEPAAAKAEPAAAPKANGVITIAVNGVPTIRL